MKKIFALWLVLIPAAAHAIATPVIPADKYGNPIAAMPVALTATCAGCAISGGAGTVFSGSVTVTNFPPTNTVFSGSVTVTNPSGTVVSGSVDLKPLANMLPGTTVYLFAFDGSTWFALLGDNTNGLDIDVTRIQGGVTIAHTVTVTGTVALSARVITVSSTSTGIGGVAVVNPRDLDFSRTLQGVLAVSRVITVSSTSTGIGGVAVVNPRDMDFSRTNQGVSPASPGVIWTSSPVGSEMSCSSYSVSVGSTAVNLLPNQYAGARHVGIRNTSLSDTLYVGDANVTTGGTGNGQAGYPIFPLESWTMDLTGGQGGKFYGRTTSATIDARVSRW
jgi:hypothetical protein